jgi:hypothetical protein
MNSASTKFAKWSTTSFGLSADTSPMELESLQAHLSTCKHLRGRFGWSYAAHDIHRFLSGRVISTSLVMLIALAAIASVF